MKTQPFSIESFITTGEIFLENLVRELEEKGVPAKSLRSDHLCFRVSTQEEYGFYKTQFSIFGEILTETPINGRSICTFKLHRPFRTKDHIVNLIELPAPKPGTSYASDFEHAEFIISDCFESFTAKFPNLSFEPVGKKTINPELCLKLDGKQAKFHHHSLERIIEIEKAEIRHIVFDFDGTLIRSRENIYEINRIVFSKILEREVSLQESIEKFHPEFSKLFEAFSISCPTKKFEAISGWGSVSEQFSYDLFDGVLELLSELKTKGFQLHLWTARDERSGRKILRDHQIESFFSTLSFATDIDSKPHANSLRFDWKSVPENQVIVVGDSPSDISGSKNIAALGGAALWDSHAKRSSLMATGAELFFYELSDLKNWLWTRTERLQ